MGTSRSAGTLFTLLAVAITGLNLPAAVRAGASGDPGAGGDGSPAMQQLRADAEARWHADVAAALRKGAVRLDKSGTPRVSALSARAAQDGIFSARNAVSPAYCYFPSGDVTDGRMLAVAGTGLSTLSDNDTFIEFSVPASAGDQAILEIGIFDGDTTRTWDIGSVASEFTLYTDSQGDGSGAANSANIVGSWSGAIMPDNDWFVRQIPVSPAARAANGHYFYTLRVHNPAPHLTSQNGFKLRSSGGMSVKPGPFALVAPRIGSVSPENGILYPAWPSLTPTTYNGILSVTIEVTEEVSYLEVWDGDMDHGSADGTNPDTDDPNTPNTLIPSWASPTSSVAEGQRGAAPWDDVTFATFRRSPAVEYSVIAPDGAVYHNSNPSGNQEWENFRLDTRPFDPALMDYHADRLPAGPYTIRISGLDLSNLEAFRFAWDMCAVDAAGNPVACIRPSYRLGDTVYRDVDGDGVQAAAGEPGIAGVTVHLKDDAGRLVAVTVTDAAGRYQFDGLDGRRTLTGADGQDEVFASGLYTVELAASNFTAGGPLHRLLSTTGGEAQTRSLYDPVFGGNRDNLDFDFGYQPPVVTASGTIGDRVWNDLDRNGIQGAGEPGIGGVRVTLLDADGNQIATQTTDAAGLYSFTGLAAGTYRVQFAGLAGFVFSPQDLTADDSDSDADFSGRTGLFVLEAGQEDLTRDAGLFRAPFRTQTQGGWGSTPSGNNPGTFLAANFDRAFPGGVVIGGRYTLRFTSAAAVRGFLPQGGPAKPLTRSAVDPTGKISVLAGQVLAATLSVGLSDAGITTYGLSGLRFVSGKMAGMTVGEVLRIANSVLGGGPLPAGCSVSDLNNAVTTINENFVDGTTDQGNLR